MKRFIYEQIVDRENICNLEQEARTLSRLILNGRNVVVYAPRN